MNRLLINHVEAYLLFANKIFTTAVDLYKDEHNRFYNGIKLLIKFVDLFLLNYLIYISAVLSSSIVGEIMINTLNSLTFLPSELTQPVITSLINTVHSLHTLNQKMCCNGKN